jgi:hypothetical protein
MKKYLFGLGAMLVGAGLMFVLTHTEVRAESEVKEPEPFVCSAMTTFEFKKGTTQQRSQMIKIINCQTKKLDCGYSPTNGNMSCVKKGGIFK